MIEVTPLCLQAPSGRKTVVLARHVWRDRNLRFHHYDRIKPSPDASELINEIDRDPTGIFWG